MGSSNSCVLIFSNHCLVYFFAVQHVYLEECLKTIEEFVDHYSYEIELIKYFENVLVKMRT
jgi:hypothetical protein